MRQDKWGGKREGAGRPSEEPKPIRFSTRLTADNSRRLDIFSTIFKNRTNVVNFLIEKYLQPKNKDFIFDKDGNPIDLK